MVLATSQLPFESQLHHGILAAKKAQPLKNSLGRGQIYRAPLGCGSCSCVIWPEFGCVYYQALELESINADVFTPPDAVAGKSQENKPWLFWLFLPLDTFQIMKVAMLCCPSNNDIALANAQKTVVMKIASEDVAECCLMLDTAGVMLGVGASTGRALTRAL